MPARSSDSCDTAWIRAFFAVAEHGTHDAAATALGCSQSTVSNRVRKLEEWLGSALLSQQSTTGLTDLGMTFFENAQEILSDLESYRRVKAAPVTNEGPVRRSGWWVRTFGDDLDKALGLQESKPVNRGRRIRRSARKLPELGWGSGPKWGGKS